MKRESIWQQISRMCEPMSDDELLNMRNQLTRKPRSKRGPITQYYVRKLNRAIDDRGLND